MKIRQLARNGALLGPVLSLIGAGAVMAQSGPTTDTGNAPLPAKGAPSTDESGLHYDEIVVTGTSEGQEKFKTPYAVTVVSSTQIQEHAPTSTADSLKQVPGIWVESTGVAGGGENIYARGLPGGSYVYFGLQEDGLPLFETNYESYLNIDELLRVDLGTERVEIVRGGTAPLFANNAPGGVANFITNHGTSTGQGALRLTTGSDGLARADFTASGPVARNLEMSFSGFGRYDDGQRDPGFRGGDKGGQVKLGATYLLDHGSIWADVKYLNDRSVFYTDIPITNPVTGQSLSGLINPNTGTLDSAAVRNVTLHTLSPNGTLESFAGNLSTGLHPRVVTATAGTNLDFSNGLTFSDKARFTHGSVNFNGIFNGQYVTGGADGFSAQAYANNLAKAAGGVTGEFVNALTGQLVDPAQDLVLANTWADIRTDFTDFINDARLTQKITTESWGQHNVTFGSYYSHYTFEQLRLIGTYLSDVNNNPQLLNVRALDASGNVIGSVTDNGFSSYGNGATGSVGGQALALYALEDWRIIDPWQVDLGVRREVEWQHGAQGILTTTKVSLPGVIVQIPVASVTSYKRHSETLDGTAWTLGSSYQFSRQVNVFARYTDSYQMPRFQNIYAGSNFNGNPLPVTNIKQAESGIKFYWPQLSVFLVGFYSRFDPLISTLLVQNSAGNLVNQNVSARTTDGGVEIEAAWSPVSFFQLRGSATLQRTKITDVIAPGYSTQGTEGKREPRIPNQLVMIEPAYLFKASEVSGRAFTTFTYVGDRFQDYNNLSRLPGYTTWDAGLTATYGPVTCGANVLNLTNSTGLTEGNARASALALTPSTPVADATIGRPIFGRTYRVEVTYRW